MIPKLNISTPSSYSYPKNISGATNPGVPANFSLSDKFFKFCLYTAKPKSIKIGL
jgi:hypothetical protein